MDVDSEHPISDIKKKIADETGIPPEEQRLMHDGKPMDDDKRLLAYAVPTFFLILSMVSFASIFNGIGFDFR